MTENVQMNMSMNEVHAKAATNLQPQVQRRIVHSVEWDGNNLNRYRVDLDEKSSCRYDFQAKTRGIAM